MRLFYSQDIPPDSIPQWQIILVAVACVIFLTIICVISVRAGTRAAVFLTFIKVLANPIFPSILTNGPFLALRFGM